MESSLELQITRLIETIVASPETATRYRQPLVAFVSADSPDFARLQTLIDPSHLLPADILPGAHSVISFFLPFDKSVVMANAVAGDTAREWAVAYAETNVLIARICATVTERLAAAGDEARWELPTYNFDPVRLVSRWSHKSVGVIAGLGSFGLHHMVITDVGCAGRFGSLVTTACLEPSSRQPAERCRYFAEGRCAVCVARCPVGALTTAGLDRARCYERCLEMDRLYADLPLTDVCGKCATGPCALQPAVWVAEGPQPPVTD
jgi:epoxyqueuosine reductase